MPIETFAPATNPSIQSSRSVGVRVNTAQFGDGYSQRSRDGLNPTARTFSAQWQALDVSDADDIEAFFERHVVDPFLWVLPLEYVSRKWIVTDWSRAYAGGDLVSLSASLKEVFDL